MTPRMLRVLRGRVDHNRSQRQGMPGSASAVTFRCLGTERCGAKCDPRISVQYISKGLRHELRSLQTSVLGLTLVSGWERDGTAAKSPQHLSAHASQTHPLKTPVDGERRDDVTQVASCLWFWRGRWRCRRCRDPHHVLNVVPTVDQCSSRLDVLVQARTRQTVEAFFPRLYPTTLATRLVHILDLFSFSFAITPSDLGYHGTNSVLPIFHGRKRRGGVRNVGLRRLRRWRSSPTNTQTEEKGHRCRLRGAYFHTTGRWWRHRTRRQRRRVSP